MSRLAAVVVLLIAAACSGAPERAEPMTTAVPVPTTEAPTTTVAPATTKATTASTVRGTPRTTTTVVLAMGPGDATINGTVNGPGGPVDGATVKIERLVGKEVASTEVRAAGGAFSVGSVLGGAYRVRAWRAPDLAQNGTEVFFLAAKEVKRLELALVQYGSSGAVATVDPSPPKVDQPATLTVKLGTGVVDPEGRVTTTPRGGIPVTLAVTPGLALESPPQQVSDAAGVAAWRLRCTAPGTFPVTLNIGTVATPVAVPPCAGA